MRGLHPLVFVMVSLAAGAALGAPRRASTAAAASRARAARKAAAAKQAAARQAAARQAAARKAAAAKQAAARKAAAAKAAKARPMPPGTKSAASQVPSARSLPVETFFRTRSDYDARIDSRPDFILLDRPGEPADAADRGIRTWKAAGHRVYRFLETTRDTSGKAVEGARAADLDLDASGKPIADGDGLVLLPTAARLGELKALIRRAVDADAQGICLAEPQLPASGGYSAAYKAAWQDWYHSAWKPPDTVPGQFFSASRLKAELGLRAVSELLRAGREYAAEKSKKPRFLLSLNSPFSDAGRGLVFSHAAASRLPVDGIVARLRPPGPGEETVYEGRSVLPYFESAWLQLTYFASLLDGQPDKPLYLMFDEGPAADPAQRERWRRAVLAASMMGAAPRGYELSAWPEGSSGANPAPAPSPMTGVLAGLATTVEDLPAQGAVEWNGGTRGIGILTLDTLAWQRGGPRGSSMRSLYGLALPLLKRGVPVQMVPEERAGDRAFLARFRVLVLSYDMQKPTGPETNEALAEWVKSGGTLVLLGGEDAYNGAADWWGRAGLAGPTEHLLKACGVQADPAARTVRVGGDRFVEALHSTAAASMGNPAPAEHKTYTVPLPAYQGEPKPVWVRISDLDGEPGGGAWLGRLRVLENGRARADFVAGSSAERAFLQESVGSTADPTGRTADGGAALVYRFNRLPPTASLQLELKGEFRVSVAVGDDPTLALEPTADAAATLPALRVASVYPVVHYALSGAQPLYRSAGPPPAAPMTPEVSPAWISPAGAGWVLYTGIPAAFGADSAAGADLVRGLVRYACVKEGLAYQEAPVVVRRGQYVAAHAMGRTMELKGRYLDLFDPDLPVVDNLQLLYLEPVIYKTARLAGRVPALLHGTHQVDLLEASTARMRLKLRGPLGSAGTLRIYLAGMTVGPVEATDSTGRAVEVEARVDGPTLRVRYPQFPDGVSLSIRWIRPEARLTK